MLSSGRDSLVEITTRRVLEDGAGTAFTFLRDGEQDLVRISRAELDRRARALAACIQDRAPAGARVLLLTPPGLDFVIGTLGIFYAGAVLVPTTAPGLLRPQRAVDHVRRLADDAGAAIAIVAESAVARAVVEAAPDLAALQWLALNDIPEAAASEWRMPSLAPNDLALLQYTSGSTHHPKGVMITHGNIAANLAFMRDTLLRHDRVEGVMWVPPYHDMGLIGGILLGIYNAHHVTLLSPAHFLQRPMRWLEAISRNRASHTAAPNFAIELCVRRSTPAQRTALDLSSLRVLLSGGEPVRADTLNRFAAAFAASGFDPRAFTPAYGLAEATLMAASAAVQRPPVIAGFDSTALRRGRAQRSTDGAATRLVGCGPCGSDRRVVIADPESGGPVSPGTIGEICLSGADITSGYWNRPDETEAARWEHDGRAYLRTGDLGFISGGELFVAGRSKDLIIVHGHNHYPQDIEETAETAHGALISHGSAAFGASSDGDEHLVVVAEIEPHEAADRDAVVRAVRHAIAARHDLPLARLVLIRRRGLPRTTSGKVRRREARRLLGAGELAVIHDWTAPALAAPARVAPNGNGSVASWLIREIAGVTGEPADCIRPDMLVTEAGLSSLQIAELVQRAEIHLGSTLSLADLPRDISIGELAAFLARAELQHGQRPSTHENGKTSEGSAFAVVAASTAAIRQRLVEFSARGLDNPFFVPHDGSACATTRIGGRELINFSTYNYLGLSGHPAVNAAAKSAIDTFGTSVLASRLVAGERPLHRELEGAIANLIGTEDCIVFVSGVLANTTVLGHIVGPDDLVVHDALAHDSIVQGSKLSGAAHRLFPHNDWRALDELLGAIAGQFRSVVVVIEGAYSMDGDIPDLKHFVEVKKRHGVWLMIDEAHSVGVLGRHGRGLAEHAGVDPSNVELWMGTLSKSLASCGGYVAGSATLVEYLKYTAPGFVYSVGMSPANAAAALAAIRQLVREPERVARLRENALLFLQLARAHGLDTGHAHGTGVIPIILGNSAKSIACAARLRSLGISAQPIIHPAVEEKAARLRFFVCADHTPQQIRTSVAHLAAVVHSLDDVPVAPDERASRDVSAGAGG